MHKVTGSTRPPGVVVMVYTAGSFGPGSRRRRMKACRPRMIGPRSAMYRQSSRIESAAAWSWTGPGQRHDRTIAVQDTERYRANRRSSPVRANAQRGIEGGVPVAPAVGRESRAHSGTATRERQSGRGSWSSLTWCREPKPPPG